MAADGSFTSNGVWAAGAKGFVKLEKSGLTGCAARAQSKLVLCVYPRDANIECNRATQISRC